MIKRRSLLTSIVIMVVLALLAACGSGGGNDAQEMEQLASCLFFPWFCVAPAKKANNLSSFNNPSYSEPSEVVIEVISQTTDSLGSVYSAGAMLGFLNAAGESGGVDAVVMKHDPAGNLIWSRPFGSVDDERAEKVSVEDNGEVMVTIVKTRGTAEVSASEVDERYALRLSKEGTVLGAWERGDR